MPNNKKRKYLEKDFQTDFGKWLKGVHKQTGAFELKVTPTESINFSRLEPHQQDALFNAKHKYMAHKIPDLGAQNPFDCFMLADVPAFVVVMFRSKDYGQKDFYMIDIDAWMKEEEEAPRKSLTMEMASRIGQKKTLA